MRKIWWKITAAVILFYVLVLSVLTPLKPGIVTVDGDAITAGNNQLELVGHNTHFSDARESMQVFLAVFGQTDTTFMCADVVDVTDNEHASINFSSPDQLPVARLWVYANNDIDGTVSLRAGAAVSPEIMEATPEVEQSLPDCPVHFNYQEASGFKLPFLPTIFETIRNLMWHVPMWFTMFFLMIISVVQGIRFLLKEELDRDRRSANAAATGLLFCVLGLITGSIWARYTWGAWWVNDPQLNGALVTFMIYAAYFVLRASIDDETKRARIASVYNIFAFVMLVVLLMILPKFTESLHPGKGGTPAFSSYDLDSTLRPLFYPAVIGWIMVGYWIYTLNLRLSRLKYRKYYEE